MPADSGPTTLKRFILWDFPRGSWQYEVKVSLILAFIFLTPRELFRDQPRPKNVVLVQSNGTESSYLLEPHLLAGKDPAAVMNEAARIIQSQAGSKNREVTRVEPVFDEEHELRGFLAYTKPRASR